VLTQFDEALKKIQIDAELLFERKSIWISCTVGPEHLSGFTISFMPYILSECLCVVTVWDFSIVRVCR